ncbi:MAG: hypothetical protein U5R31_04370 [Acidimicrobiia bacterium]|nr:hypothetical protein [Acidimicrobiia bacterium]
MEGRSSWPTPRKEERRCTQRSPEGGAAWRCSSSPPWWRAPPGWALARAEPPTDDPAVAGGATAPAGWPPRSSPTARSPAASTPSATPAPRRSRWRQPVWAARPSTVLRGTSRQTSRTSSPCRTTTPWATSSTAPAGSAGRSCSPVVMGEDPTSFGGVDLVARLEGTLGEFEPGLYGSNNPSFDGVFRQGLAILGIAAAGELPAGAAVEWLEDQQCDGDDPSSTEGAWTAYRADTTAPCPEADPVGFSGPDTNATALATMAIYASESESILDADPVDFLRSVQTSEGWASIPGGSADPNSTGLVIQALVAAGEAPGEDADDALLSWQLGCDVPEEERGGFTSPFADPAGSANLLATIDAVPAAAGAVWPLPADSAPADTVPEVDCTSDDGGNGDAWR